MPSEVHYHDYLQLDKILNAQFFESDKQQLHAHDEMLFIVIHQAYELWFKQLHHEVDSIVAIFSKPSLNDNSPELQTIVHRLNRCVTILRVLVHQIDIMETMTPMDFLDFRDMLRPASGFQSWQFKELEAKLGLKFEHRHGKEYYTAQLRPEHVQLIKKAEADVSLLQLLNGWLERMPFFNEKENWSNFLVDENAATENVHPFWAQYRRQYQNSLAEVEKNNLQYFDEIFLSGKDQQVKPGSERSLSTEASRAALFIMLYRGYPMLQLPFQLLNSLLEIDEQLSSWRYRHMNMVHRMIGTRIGTGGSTGKDYLKAAADKHYIYREIAQLNSFLIERRKLPALPPAVEKRLGFVAV
ncbi:tryptophan 2,3-dioxygenase [Terrimonas pollutisoli]|uniref:tryptophan 2,3-dioxygenase n=1 Tax=Terrimonas pollutisoli TaxID=3034147 RepID=UPI0023EB5AC6|nr:tryptophan 2,3-dioxygenase family protein [Terrimonas sp. H1YJ31]